jgi:hypothetical protein
MKQRSRASLNDFCRITRRWVICGKRSRRVAANRVKHLAQSLIASIFSEIYQHKLGPEMNRPADYTVKSLKRLLKLVAVKSMSGCPSNFTNFAADRSIVISWPAAKTSARAVKIHYNRIRMAGAKSGHRAALGF